MLPSPNNRVASANKKNNLSLFGSTKNASLAPLNTLNTKKNNTSNVSSFTSIPSPASITKSLNSSLSDLYSPVKDSVNEAMDNSNSIVTVPVMLAIGTLTILLIILTLFRDQVAFTLQYVWNRIRSLFNTPVENTEPVNDTGNMPNTAIDLGAIKQSMPGAKEVFNIADNKYKYSDAEPLCKAYGAELATYDQVKDAWNKGADWCNYGWVKGQSAVYPTQESTYTKLQAGPEDQKNACGITGVNGGYFDNPELRFGVTCYGAKPGKTDTDERAQQRSHGMTNDGLEYDRKVQGYKTEIHEIPISPFNSTQWA